MSSGSLFIPSAWAKGRQTQRSRILLALDKAIVWSMLENIAKPYYDDIPRQNGGRPRHPLGRMLRLLLIAELYELPDSAVEDAVADSRAMMLFIGYGGWEGRVPSGEALRLFRKRLEQSGCIDYINLTFADLIESANLSLVQTGRIVEPVIRRRRMPVREQG